MLCIEPCFFTRSSKACPSNCEPGAQEPCLEELNGHLKKHPKDTPWRRDSCKLDIRATAFNMTGSGHPGCDYMKSAQSTLGVSTVMCREPVCQTPEYRPYWFASLDPHRCRFGIAGARVEGPNRSESPNRRQFASLDLQKTCQVFASQANNAGFSRELLWHVSCEFRST